MSVVPGDLKASLPKLPQQTDFAPPMAAMPATRVIALTNMFTDDDLKTMFGMFDITRRGMMSSDQVKTIHN